MDETAGLIEITNLKIGQNDFFGLKASLHNAPLLLIFCKSDTSVYVGCGLLNIQTSEKLNHVAGVVRGVKTFDDVLNADVLEMTSRAKEICGNGKLSGKEFLEKVLEKVSNNSN